MMKITLLVGLLAKTVDLNLNSTSIYLNNNNLNCSTAKVLLER